MRRGDDVDWTAVIRFTARLRRVVGGELNTLPNVLMFISIAGKLIKWIQTGLIKRMRDDVRKGKWSGAQAATCFEAETPLIGHV